MAKQYYDEVFKREAVFQALQSSQSIAKTAKNLGVKASTLYQWVSLSKESGDVNLTVTENGDSQLLQELKQLRRDNAALKEELVILKRIVSYYFSKDIRDSD